MHELEARLAEAKQLPVAIASNSLSGVLFCFEYDPNNHLILIAPRQQQDIVVGYIQISVTRNTSRWQVNSVWLEKKYRGEGLITNLYRALTAGGYKLQSGDGLSDEAEQVWRSLGRAGIAKVLDMSTGELEEFSEKPVGDGDIVNGAKPRFYWVTEGQKLLTIFHRGGVARLQENRDDYLAGKTTLENFHLGGMGCHGIEAEV